uniref:hematopoietic death receptor isoform X2 n=1 Tax=Doryrhamphus excisus TaxID=161450 RepID=UPI0025AE51CD|nr:hematopoietic death receptor isoform X2 [Doryrhamphus excisus]
MTRILHVIVPLVLTGLLASVATFPQAGSDLRYARTRRGVVCGDEEYLNNNICCLKCSAGTYVKSDCTKSHENGSCEVCADKTYTEHANGLNQCLKCTACRSDQEIVTHCNRTQDTKCQCTNGGFCDPKEACEVCKICSSCGNDEIVVRNCTATTNTECKKIELQDGSDCLGNGVKTEHVRETRTEQTQSVRRPSRILSQSLVRIQNPAATEDECQGLCESINSSASNSQQNVTVPPTMREAEPFPKMIPKNGVESLRMCFQYFEKVDFDYHRKFFRQLGMNDNVIKSNDQLGYNDKIHELLNIWLQKEGKEASLNDLLNALLECQQRHSAETIKENALEDGHYILEKSSQP